MKRSIFGYFPKTEILDGHQVLDDVIVNKPWGWEYLCFRNANLAMWLLHIDSNQQTSMHSHPNKNTGYIVLNGAVELSWINSKEGFESLSKVNIFKRRFHSTRAVSKKGAYLIEIESPEDKSDLVRLNDAYGREGMPYEGEKAYSEKDNSCFALDQPSCTPKTHTLFGCKLSHLKCNSIADLALGDALEFYVFTDGGLVSQEGSTILVPGEVTDGATLGRLTSKFALMPGSSILRIWQ